MTRCDIAEARTSLEQLLDRAEAGEEVVIERDGRSVRLVPTQEGSGEPLPPRRGGDLRGKIWIAPDFDDPLEDFKEYM